MPHNETDTNEENERKALYKKKSGKNYVILAIIMGLCALIWLMTMVKMAQADEMKPAALLAPSGDALLATDDLGDMDAVDDGDKAERVVQDIENDALHNTADTPTPHQSIDNVSPASAEDTTANSYTSRDETITESTNDMKAARNEKASAAPIAMVSPEATANTPEKNPASKPAEHSNDSSKPRKAKQVFDISESFIKTREAHLKEQESKPEHWWYDDLADGTADYDNVELPTKHR